MIRKVLFLFTIWLTAFTVFAEEPQQFSDTTAVHELHEIVVKGSNIRQTPTGYVISLANQAIAKEKSAIEVFNFLPDVTVMDEVIKIGGKEVTRIKVDGQRIDDYNFLKSIPASYIKSITVNMFAGADNISTSTGGTIGIDLKPIASLGYYGQLSGSATKNLCDLTINGNVNGMISGRYKRLSVYESAYWSANKILAPTGYSYIKPGSVEQRQVNDRFKNFPFQNYLALNLELNQDHNLGINWITATTKTNASYSEPHQEPEMNDRYHTHYNIVSLLYRGNINNNRGSINVSAEWLNHLNDENQVFPDASNNVDLSQRSNLLRLEGTYMHQVGQKQMFTSGFTYLYTRSNIHQQETAQESTGFNQTTMGHLPLVFVSMDGVIGALSYYGGLNWKMNKMKIKGQKPYSVNAFQPTVNLSVPLDKAKAHRLSFTYKYLLDNITYDAFNNRQIWLDPYIYMVGNPDIIAPTSHSLALRSSLWNSCLNIGLNFTRTKNEIEWRTFSVPGSLITYQTPVNMPLHDAYSLTINFNMKLFNFWTISLFTKAGFYRDHYFMGDEIIKNTTFRHIYFMDNSFSFGKGWGGSLNATLDPGFDRYNEHWHTVWQINMGVYKMLCNDRLMLNLSGTPARKHRIIDVKTADMTIQRKNLSNPQCVTFSVRWTFDGGGNKNASVDVTGSKLEYEESKASKGF